MRISTIVFGFAALLATSPAFAETAIVPAPDQSVPTLAPGDQISIACDAIDHRSADSDVRVVLTISALPDSLRKLGVTHVMATDEQLSKNSVSVRVPSVAPLDDQTVNLNVYVVDRRGAKSCDGGHLKIAQDKKAEPQNLPPKKS
ncbi:MAG: hypothetical protein WBQ17_16650 [Rhizomicrobium sp.]|jgi:hypothetical protein